MIPAYLRGDVNESYYWLGRIAHLLEDATSIPHVHNDAHPPTDDSVLEKYTGDNFTLFQNRYNWSGENFAGNQYNYENLPNMASFNWREVEPTRPLDRQNIELFRLLWYVAQKTQYFASDDDDGNTIYVNLSGNQKTFSPTLWTNDNVTIISNSIDLADDDIGDTGPDIEKETNAMIPHAMKSVAGLYRLFWDAVQVDWKFYHHDVRNTGFTLLKGDLNTSNKQIWNYSSAPATDFWDEAVIAEIDDNLDDGQEVIVATANSDYTDGRVYALDGDTNTQLWTFDEPLAAEPVSVDDVDGNRIKEVIVGSHDLYLYSVNSQNGAKNWRYLINNQTDAFGPWRSAIFDINNDGSKEIVFGETGETGTYNGHVVALNSNGKQVWNSSTTAVQGFQTDAAIADLTGDGIPEVIITAGDGVYVYNGSNGVEVWRKHMANAYASPVVADLDNDNDYEVIVATSKNTIPGELCASGTCYSGINVLDNNGNMLWNKTVDHHVVAIPAVANLDSDSNLEIVVATALTPDFVNLRNTNFNNGSVYLFDGVTGNMDWGTKFIAGAKIQSSPAVADIDNDNALEIIFGAYDGLLYVLAQNKSIEWTHNFSSYLIANPAIGDIDGDRVAEIVVKHANHLGPSNGQFGGGRVLFTNKTFTTTKQMSFGATSSSGDPSTLEALGGVNIKPVLGNISNISIKEEDLVNINMSSQVMATDANNDSLVFYYSSPLNSSGSWQTDCTSSGNYSVLVEVSDGSLSDFRYVNVQVNETCAGLTITSLNAVYSNATRYNFEFAVKNFLDASLNNVTWNINFGDGSVLNSTNIILNSQENMSAYVDYTYLTVGTYVVNATATNGSLTRSRNITINVS
ncbi:PQQ-binding-like beta-propeller repeat protein [Candidatus Woesearchaeota archaeon]|nr:PQQ-binding-like beta-propeller repeat protein [Candidatus Woesearchaeota archaeon]